MIQKPPFPNDHNFLKQITAAIGPSRQFPFVHLKSLVEENKDHISGNKSSDSLTLKCHICSKGFLPKSDFSWHLTQQHQEVESRFTCSVCPQSYQTCQELNIHLRTKHPDQFELSKQRNLVLARMKKYECPHCPKKFISASALSKHIPAHTKQTSFACDVCGAKYRRAQDIRLHKKKCQPKISDDAQVSTTATTSKCFICLFCGYKASDSSKLENHNRSHTGEKPFECKACGAKFASNPSLNRHIRVSCTKAKKIGLAPDIQTAATTRTESDTKDAESGHQCTICGKKFKRKTDRKNHEAKHGDKFMCQSCPVGFETCQGLRQHNIFVHPENVRTYQCNNCQNLYVERKAFKTHKSNCIGMDEGEAKSLNLEVDIKYNIHVDPLALPTSSNPLVTKRIKKFHCQYCPQKFMHKSQLLMHSTSHNNNMSKEKNLTDDLPSLKCHICSKEFTHQSTLSKHLTLKHKEVEKPFVCSVCQECYKTCQELNIHLGTKHPDQFELSKQRNLVLAIMKKYECPHCPKKFVSTSKLSKHINTHSIQTYRRDIQKHQQSQLIPEQNIQLSADSQMSTTTFKHLICLLCGYKAPNSLYLERHNRSQTGEKPFECKACESKFSDKANLNKHIPRYCTKAKEIGLVQDISTVAINPKVYTKDPQDDGYPCKICHQKFKQSRNEHEEIHGDRFMCQSCPVGFETHQGLTNHKLYLHPERVIPYHCNNCQKVCVSHTAFETHQSNFIGMDEGQAGSNDLEVEVKYDISADPLALPASPDPDQLVIKFQCHPQMHKSQTHPTSLINLSKEKNSTSFVNSDDLAFECQICSTKFKYKVKLTNHLKNDHPEVEKPFACSLCSETYKSSQEISLHLGTEHPDQFKLEKKGDRVFARIKKRQGPHCPKTLLKSITPKLKDQSATHSDEISKRRKISELGTDKSKDNCQPVDNNNLKMRTIIPRYFVCLLCGYLAPNSYDLESHNRSHTSLGLLTPQIQQESSNCRDVELEEDIEDKDEIPFPAEPLLAIDDMDQNNINLLPSDSETFVPIDPISSWVQSVTNSADPLALNSFLSNNEVIPTTVLKME